MREPGWAERLFDSAGNLASNQHCIVGSLTTLEVISISMECEHDHSREGTFEPQDVVNS
jgi:hypothetical protein